MYDSLYRPRGGGFRGSPRGGGRGRGGGGWSSGGNQGGGYYSSGGGSGQMMDGGYRGRGGGGYRGGRGGQTGSYGGGRNDNYGGGRGGYRGGRGGYVGQRGGSVSPYHGPFGGRGGLMTRGGMGGGYRGGPSYRGGMDMSRGGQMNKSLDLDKRKRMVKIVLDNKLNKADIEELKSYEGVVDLHLCGPMFADYKESEEAQMLATFQDAEQQLMQAGIPVYVDLTGNRSKNYGKESVRDLRRVDVRNLPEKTSLDAVKEAFPGATAVWRNSRYNYFELLFANEEEACEAILGGQQREINGVLPYVLFHRENQADLSKRAREEEESLADEQPASKKMKTDENGEEITGGEVEQAPGEEAVQDDE